MPEAARPRYAYLGPEGTFAEAALRSIPSSEHAELRAADSVPDALDAVRDGSVDAALVPFESSVEGSVNTTLDEFISGAPLHIAREALLPVRFSLLARAATTLGDITAVGSHPHGAAQCRHWLRQNLDGARVVLAASTAQAAAAVAEGTGAYEAAIAATSAAQRYGLVELASDIGDNREAVTRFVLAVRPAPPQPPTGADRTTVVAFIADDHPGALLELLTEFAVRGVNLTRIESRPTGHGLGRYCFCIDCEGHVDDARVGDALAALHRFCQEVRFCGSYPRADGERPTRRRGTSDEDFGAAAAWLARVRGEGA